MPNTAVIDISINTQVDNTSSTDFSVMCIYEGVIVNNPPVLTSPVEIYVTVDGFYELDASAINALVTDIEGDALSKAKIVETVGVGSLTFGTSEIPLINNDVIDYSEIGLVKFTPIPGSVGLNYTTLTLKFIDDGDSPRCWSNDLVITFHVTAGNQEPTVSDHQVEVDYGTTTVLTASFFTQDYHDPELDPFGHVDIESLPPAGQGDLWFQGSMVEHADLPLTVTAAQLDNDDLEYIDSGEEIYEKKMSINFTTYDNVP